MTHFHFKEMLFSEKPVLAELVLALLVTEQYRDSSSHAETFKFVLFKKKLYPQPIKTLFYIIR